MSDVKAKKFPGKFSASMPLQVCVAQPTNFHLMSPPNFSLKYQLIGLFQAEFVGWLLSDTPKLRPNATEIKQSEMLQRITQQAHQSRKIESESG